MKRFVGLVIVILVFSTRFAFADGSFTIIYTDEEYKAVTSTTEYPQEWLQHAWNNKARKCVDRIIDEETNLNYNKLTKEEKEQIIRDKPLKTAKEKKAKKDTE